MKETRWIRIKAAILTAALVSTVFLGKSYGYADEIGAAVETVIETNEGIDLDTVPEDGPESKEGAEPELVTQMETETMFYAEMEMEQETESEAGKEGLVENSFRYNNGEWLHNEISLYAGGFTPWTYEDGSWMNSLGEPIVGAIEKGIDVSYIQKQIDWEAVAKTDVSFAIIRCGYGNNELSQDDSRWKYNADECTRLGIPFGVYIYSYALNTDEARSEAEHVLRLVEGYNLSLPIYLDLEDERYTGSLSNEQIADIADTFCETIQSAGYEVGIYANLNWFRNRLTDWRFTQWPRWVAQYNYECDYEKNYSMWQCTSSGVVDGIEGFVDLNFTMNVIPKEPEADPPEQQVRNFVKRLYELTLNRKPDAAGLESWTNLLLNKEKTGAEVAEGFIMSKEFLSRDVSNEEYVEILYQTFLDRKSDKSGKADWVKRLSEGLSRMYVFKGFAESEEFGGLCQSYGIIRGEITLTDILDLNPDITMFVYRNYKQFLDRKPDKEGQIDWVTRLVQKDKSPKQVAYGFVFSKEFEDKHLSDEEYVKVLYRGIFDREADKTGLKSWTDLLSQGKSREEIFNGFADSDEFARMAGRFGL